MVCPCGTVLALLMKPLRHRALGAEVHLACPISAVAAAARAPRLHAHARAHTHSNQPRSSVTGMVAGSDHLMSQEVAVAKKEENSFSKHSLAQNLTRAQPDAHNVRQAIPDVAALRHLDRPCGSSTGTVAGPAQLDQGKSCIDTACTHAAHTAQRAVVRVLAARSWASGVIISVRGGLVLTNAHAVAPASGSAVADSRVQVCVQIARTCVPAAPIATACSPAPPYPVTWLLASLIKMTTCSPLSVIASDQGVTACRQYTVTIDKRK